MKLFRVLDMTRGWFVGDFEPSVFRTSAFEVAWIRHRQHEEWPRHRHNQAIEINLLMRGSMVIDEGELGARLVQAGTIFVIEPGETIRPIFLKDCELIVVKIPSLPGDKEEVSNV